MIKFRYGDALIIGVTRDNVDALMDDNPMRIDMTDMGEWPTPPSSVIVAYRETGRELMEEFVRLGIMPQSMLDSYRDPQPGEVRRMSG